ncbi:MAG: divalent-cation tolerance protein CutA [Pirellulales bacterium]
MTGFIQIITSVASQAEAERIGRALVERRLAACMHVSGPITSVYRWQDKIETSSEWVCAVKTSAGLYANVEAAIRELHSYEVPEILAAPIVAGSTAYLDWLRSELIDPSEIETA